MLTASIRFNLRIMIVRENGNPQISGGIHTFSIGLEEIGTLLVMRKGLVIISVHGNFI